MTKSYVYNPVSKASFKKWHSEGALLLLAAGFSHLEDVLAKLDDSSIDRRAQGRQVSRADIDGKYNKIIMFSNGVEEFVIVIDSTPAPSGCEGWNADQKTHLTIYVVND